MRPGDLLFHLAIGSRFENIELVQVVLADSLERLGIEQDARHWIDVAVREAVANAIKHGNRQDPGKKVEVDLLMEDGDLIIQIQDQGEGFDPEQLKNPLDPANLLRPNGRGIFYMRNFMDRVDYSPRRGGGTVVTLRKRVAAIQPAP
jgi:serine/threonine-protein kinase RsbW